MRRMKRAFFLLLIVFLLPSAFACGEGAQNTAESTPDETAVISSEGDVEKEESSASEVFEESAETESESAATVKEDTVISFIACADNLVHPSMYYDAIERAAERDNVKPDYSDLHNASYDFSPIYTHIAPYIENADIAFINQESLIGGDSKKISAYPRFNTPKPMANAVSDVGFDIVNVAHNHMLDSGNTVYLEYCSALFESLGMKVLGCYPNAEAADDILIIEEKGVKIAFLTYTYGTNGLSAGRESEFVIPYFDEELIDRQISIAKAKADVLIVSCHWGDEYRYTPNSMQKKYAEYLCEKGADVIIGMHSHCIEPMEWMVSEDGHRTLVTYSLGTMVSGIRKGMSTLAGMLSFDIVKNGETEEISIEQVLFIPTVAHYTRGKSVADDDSGSRGYTVYPLCEYDEELAKTHSLVRAEIKEGKTTLIGGGFSRETLIKTVKEYIPEEFLLPLE